MGCINELRCDVPTSYGGGWGREGDRASCVLILPHPTFIRTTYKTPPPTPDEGFKPRIILPPDFYNVVNAPAPPKTPPENALPLTRLDGGPDLDFVDLSEIIESSPTGDDILALAGAEGLSGVVGGSYAAGEGTLGSSPLSEKDPSSSHPLQELAVGGSVVSSHAIGAVGGGTGITRGSKIRLRLLQERIARSLNRRNGLAKFESPTTLRSNTWRQFHRYLARTIATTMYPPTHL